jgi:hypothetical protein
MFCEKCDNFMDITSNIYDTISSDKNEENNVNENIANENNDIHEEENNDISSDNNTLDDIDMNNDNESSDYNTLSPDIASNEIINDILNGKNIIIKQIDKFYNDLPTNPNFNKLNQKDKTLILNRLYEKLPKNSKILKTQTTNRPASFYCKNCGYNFKIKNETFIFSRNKNNTVETFNTNIISNKYDTTLPYIRDYTCINTKCPTHKNPNIKKAVFYRKNNSYYIKYICTICDSHWNNN